MKIYATRIADPAALPIEVSEAKAQLRIAHADDDALLGDLVAAAVSAVEERTGRALITQTWRVDTYGLSGRAPLLMPVVPVQSIDEITYLDADGAEQTANVADFRLTADHNRAIVEPAPGKVWPDTGEYRDAIRVSVVAGYGSGASGVPPGLRAAMLYMVDFWFTRSAALEAGAPEIPPTAEMLIDQHRTGWIAG